MAHLMSSFRASGARPPTRMSYGISSSLNPWKATAYLKPREMTELIRGKLASWISVEVMCQWAKAPLGCHQPLHRHELTPFPANCDATGLYNGPHLFSLEEPYQDTNGNGQYDAGDPTAQPPVPPEPFLDCPTPTANGGMRPPDGRWDGIYLDGGSGHNRLPTEVLDPIQVLPSPAQGALAVECRADDEDLIKLLSAVDDRYTRAAATAERAMLAALEGGCTAPIAALAEIAEGDTDPEIYLRGSVTASDGSAAVRLSVTGPVTDADGLGRRLAAELISEGATDLLATAQASSTK